MDGTATPAAARHSHVHADWQTPLAIIDAARQTMGGIDLDPASDLEANARVQATRFYSAAADGLSQRWEGRVFLNPPGGQVTLFWEHLVAEYAAQRVTQALWVGYSLEQLQTLQVASYITPLDFPLCITKRRIAFDLSAPQRAARLKQGLTGHQAPSHSNYLCYLGHDHEAFQRVFGVFGKILNTVL